MANSIIARNVNHALVDGIWLLRTNGLREDSRNGPVVVAPGPVATTYLHPTERVLWSSQRDANPVFHLMEAIWMLAGQRNVSWLSQFSGNIARYAEDNGIMHGAYGHRWRDHFGQDQLLTIVEMLRRNPNERRCVLQMWDVDIDLGADKRDIPCNTHAYFDCRGGRLNMTVCNRSNDIVWGAYGANAVHFSMLQELIAAGVGLPVGTYTQFSNNYHLYLEMEPARTLFEHPSTAVYDPYCGAEPPQIVPMVGPNEDWQDFLGDCRYFVDGGHDMQTKFMAVVAEPLRLAYMGRKHGVSEWTRPLMCMPECDWKRAFVAWAARRNVI
jgi:hypothetical protein